MNQDLSTSLEMTVGSGRDDRMEALEVTRRKRGFLFEFVDFIVIQPVIMSDFMP